MENTPILDSEFQSEAGLEVSREARSYLNEAGRWARFLAILGFIGAGLLVFLGLSSFVVGSATRSMGTPFPTAFLGIIYLALAVVYIFPCLYLYRFASQAKMATQHNDSGQLTESLGNLKATFKFFGILSIILIALQVIGVLLFAVVGADLINGY